MPRRQANVIGHAAYLSGSARWESAGPSAHGEYPEEEQSDACRFGDGHFAAGEVADQAGDRDSLQDSAGLADVVDGLGAELRVEPAEKPERVGRLVVGEAPVAGDVEAE